MSSEIKSDQEMILLLSKMNAEERFSGIYSQSIKTLLRSRFLCERIPFNHDP